MVTDHSGYRQPTAVGAVLDRAPATFRCGPLGSCGCRFRELSLSRRAGFPYAPYRGDADVPWGTRLQQREAQLQTARENTSGSKRNKHRQPATYREGEWVAVHHRRLQVWPPETSNDPCFGPYRIAGVEGHRNIVRCSPRQGGGLAVSVSVSASPPLLGGPQRSYFEGCRRLGGWGGRLGGCRWRWEVGRPLPAPRATLL